MMSLIKNIKTAGVLFTSLAWTSQSVFAQVNDMVGGPKVRQLTLHEPVTKIASEIYSLHNLLLAICLVIFCVVFGVMFYSIYAHRKSKGAVGSWAGARPLDGNQVR